MDLKVKRLRENAVLPRRATDGSAGYDLSACLDKPVEISPKERVLIPTGLSVELPGTEVVGLIYVRSSLGIKRGLTLPNGVGVIDCDYRGEMMVAIINLSDETVSVMPGERIAQLVITPVLLPEVCEVDVLSETVRGTGGFGSTGRGVEE